MKAGALTRVGLVIALVCSAALSGCSWIASTPPSKTPLATAGQCSNKHFAATADTIGTIATGSLALLAWGLAEAQYESNQTTVVPSWDQKPLTVNKSLYVVGGLSTAATVALFVSSKYGHRLASECDVARLELLRSQPPAWEPNAGYPYGYPSPNPLPPAPPPRPWVAPSPAPPPRAGTSTPPVVVLKIASVVVPSAEARSAPSLVAPVVVVVTKGQRLLVDPTAHAGWRLVSLWDGRVAYIEDAQVKVDPP